MMTMVVVMMIMFMMIKFDPHEGNSILTGLQMLAHNADCHQRLPENNEGVHDEEHVYFDGEI